MHAEIRNIIANVVQAKPHDNIGRACHVVELLLGSTPAWPVASYIRSCGTHQDKHDSIL